MDDDDDYFTPTTSSSRRLAMLFNPEDMTASSSSNHSSPTTHFKFVAPKQPRSTHSSSASGDSHEVLLEVPLILLSEGAEKNGMPRTRVNCRVVSSAVKVSYSLVVATAEQVKRELWRAAIDSHVALEVIDQSTIKVTAHTNEALTLNGEAPQIEALVAQVTICRGMASSSVTQQDLYTGTGHVLATGDVAKVSYATYSITTTTRRGGKLEEIKGVKITVSPPTAGSWESCLAGATADTHRLIYIPTPERTLYDVKIAKVKTKGGREKAVAGARSGSQSQEQQQTLNSLDTSATSPPSTIKARAEAGDGHERDAEEEDGASRKAALVTRMAQVGTQIFPMLPSAKLVSQSQVKPQVAEKSREAPAVAGTVSASASATTTPTHVSATPSPATTSVSTTSPTPFLIATTTTTTTPASTSTSSSTPVTITSTGSISGPTSSTNTNTSLSPTSSPAFTARSPASSEAPDITLTHSLGQFGTTLTKIADRVELLLTKLEKVETKNKVEAEGSCVPETLMSLASGLVTQNEKLKIQLEETEKRLVESQAAHTSLLTMNTQLLEEKREMLRKEAELRKEVEDKGEELKRIAMEHNKLQEQKEEKERNQQKETEPGLTPKEVQSLVKATLNGLFRRMASDFSEEKTQYSQPEVLQTLRSGLEVAYSSFVENLENMTEDGAEEQELEQEELPGEEEEVQEGGEREGEGKQNEEYYKRKEEMSGENSSVQE